MIGLIVVGLLSGKKINIGHVLCPFFYTEYHWKLLMNLKYYFLIIIILASEYSSCHTYPPKINVYV